MVWRVGSRREEQRVLQTNHLIALSRALASLHLQRVRIASLKSHFPPPPSTLLRPSFGGGRSLDLADSY